MRTDMRNKVIAELEIDVDNLRRSLRMLTSAAERHLDGDPEFQWPSWITPEQKAEVTRAHLNVCIAAAKAEIEKPGAALRVINGALERTS